MAYATLRNDGEHYRVYVMGARLSGQYSLEQARNLRDKLNKENEEAGSGRNFNRISNPDGI